MNQDKRKYIQEICKRLQKKYDSDMRYSYVAVKISGDGVLLIAHDPLPPEVDWQETGEKELDLLMYEARLSIDAAEKLLGIPPAES
jgi:hypothetical protein